MATSIGQLEQATAIGRAGPARTARPWVGVGVALGAAYLPHLVFYARNLMGREHYQFFPLAWIGALVLAWNRRGAWTAARPPERTAPGWAGVGLGVLLLIGAGALPSSWLAMASVPPMALGLAWLAGGAAAARGVVPSLLLFATTLRPPAALDLALIGSLRALAVRTAGPILDRLEVIFVPLGNVLRVPGGDLLVDEACSGVNSLVSIVAVVLFLGLLLRRRPLHLALLLLWSVVVVILANVGRVTIVALAFARYRIDLIHGWRHETLGLALYAVSLLLVASFEQLLFLFEPLFRRRSARTPDHDAAAADRQAARDRPPVGPRSARVLLVAGCLGVVALILPARWAGGRRPEAGPAALESVVRRNRAALGEQALPAELAGWRRVGFRTEERQREDVFGQYSSVWEYQLGSRKVLLSVDYPFLGWHELLLCYDGVNWKARGRATSRGDLGEGMGPPLPHVVADLDKGTGEHATLHYALIDEENRWAQPPVERGLLGRDPPWEAADRRVLSQVQLFGSGYRVADDEERRMQDGLFGAACRHFHRTLFADGRSEP